MHHNQIVFIPWRQDGSTYKNQKCNRAHEQKKDKIHIIISKDAEKA
jgi:hypothetical protein